MAYAELDTRTPRQRIARLTYDPVGTGLFVASGKTLAVGGPASVLLAYMFIGAMLYCTVQALGELAVIFPVAGSFSAFATRFLDPSWGFSMGWKYVSLLLSSVIAVAAPGGPSVAL